MFFDQLALCPIKGVTDTVENFLHILSQKYPNAKNLIKISNDAITLPYPDKMKQETLDKLFKMNDKMNTNVTPITTAISKIANRFEKLKQEKRLHSKDIQNSKL